MSTSAQQMLQVAEGELGVGCPGACNKYGDWYGEGLWCQAWCGMFVSWCAAQSGNADVIPKFAYTPTGAGWFKSRGQWTSGLSGVRPGDIVFFDFPGDSVRRIQHVGVVQSAYANGVYTIEGNTSSVSQANGGCVQRKFRTVAGGVVGYGRPAYGSQRPPLSLGGWLQKGDTSLEVAQLQQMLMKLGYSVGPAGDDGVFGDSTYLAVIKFQTDHGLVPDGMVGPATWGTLLNAEEEDIMASIADLEAVLDRKSRPAPWYRVPGTHLGWEDLGTARRAGSEQRFLALGSPGIADLDLSDSFWRLPIVGNPLYREAYRQVGYDEVWYVVVRDGGLGRAYADREDYLAAGSPGLIDLPVDHPLWTLPVYAV